MWRFTTKRYAVFVLLIAVAAGALRFWADVDWDTLVDRHPSIGHGSLWYHPLGSTIGLILNMPVALFCALALPSELLRHHMQGLSWGVWWAVETGVAIAQSAFTALFWLLARIAILRMREVRRFSQTLFLVDSGVALAFACGAAWALVQGVRGLPGLIELFGPPFSEVIAYIKLSWFMTSGVVEPILFIALAVWCAAAAVLFSSSAIGMKRAKMALLRG